MATNQISTSPYLLSDANQATYNYGQLPPDQALEEQALNRKQHIANLLIQQGLANAGANHGQMVGRFYVPGSPVQNLAGLASIAAGAYGTHKLDQSREGLTQKSNDILVEALANYKRATSDVPGVAGPAAEQGGEPPTAQLERLLGPGADQSNLPQTIPNNVNFGQGEGPSVHPMTGAPLGEPPDTPPIPPGEGVQIPEPQPREQVVQALMQQAPQPMQGPVSPGTPARPRTAEERQQALVDLMMSQHPQAARLGQFLQGIQENQTKHAEDLAVRREGIAANTELRKGQIEASMQNTQAMIESRQQAGQDTRQLQAQLAGQQADLQKTLHQMDIEGRKDIAGMQREQGKTPPGYRATPEGNLEAIPGGPADLKLQGALNTDTAMLQGSNAAFDRLGSSANALLNHPGLGGITGIRGKIPNIPGSAAADAEAQLATLKSQIGFGVMQELRNNSKSGSSGLGALSDAEGKRLEQNLAALDKAQSLDQMKSSLQSILDYSSGAKDRLREAFNMKHKTGEPMPIAPTGKGPAVGTIEGGYKFKGGDPAKAESWEKQ